MLFSYAGYIGKMVLMFNGAKIVKVLVACAIPPPWAAAYAAEKSGNRLCYMV